MGRGASDGAELERGERANLRLLPQASIVRRTYGEVTVANMAKKSKNSARTFTVPEVWRAIVKKNERQAGKPYDVLVCQHAVPANDNTYRKARACPECRVTVQQYADEVASCTAQAPRRRGQTHRDKSTVSASEEKLRSLPTTGHDRVARGEIRGPNGGAGRSAQNDQAPDGDDL